MSRLEGHTMEGAEADVAVAYEFPVYINRRRKLLFQEEEAILNCAKQSAVETSPAAGSSSLLIESGVEGFLEMTVSSESGNSTPDVASQVTGRQDFTMRCPIVGCGFRCSTVPEFDSHYEMLHSRACAVCRKVLPSGRLLSMHISEAHDAFFQAKAAKGIPMFECIVETCSSKFVSDSARLSHLVDRHGFPPTFRFHGRAFYHPSQKQRRKGHTGMGHTGKSTRPRPRAVPSESDTDMAVCHQTAPGLGEESSSSSMQTAMEPESVEGGTEKVGTVALGAVDCGARACSIALQQASGMLENGTGEGLESGMVVEPACSQVAGVLDAVSVAQRGMVLRTAEGPEGPSTGCRTGGARGISGAMEREVKREASGEARGSAVDIEVDGLASAMSKLKTSNFVPRQVSFGSRSARRFMVSPKGAKGQKENAGVQGKGEGPEEVAMEQDK